MVKQRIPSRPRPRVQGDPAALGGGFHEGLALLRGPPGIMLTLTAPQMRRKGTSPNTLANATPQTGEAAAHPTTWRVFATLSTNLGSAPPHSQRRTTKKIATNTTSASTTTGRLARGMASLSRSFLPQLPKPRSNRLQGISNRGPRVGDSAH